MAAITSLSVPAPFASSTRRLTRSALGRCRGMWLWLGAGGLGRVAGEDAGDVRAVAELVVGGGIVVEEALPVDDSAGEIG